VTFISVASLLLYHLVPRRSTYIKFRSFLILLQLVRSKCRFDSFIFLPIWIFLSFANNQWRSKALRGPGSTVTWGSSFPSPPLPLPPLSLLFPAQPLPLREAPPKFSYRGSGERCMLPQRGLERSPSRNRIWCIWWQQF